MAESNLFINPADIALPHAEQMVTKGLLDGNQMNDEARRRLVAVELMARDEGLLGERYQVLSRRGVLTPLSFDETGETSVNYFNDMRFEGELTEYSIVRLRGIGKQVMSALCLTFDNVRPVPGVHHLTNGTNLFHVPAFAVSKINSLKAA